MSFAPEDRLMLLTSRVAPDARARRAAATLLAGPLDWDYLLEAAVRHGVAPLMARSLAALSAEGAGGRVPAPAAERLRWLAATSQARNDRLYGTIGDIVAAFGRHGVRTVGLKDVHLALEVYPERGLRPIGDVDLLIHRGDYDAVARAMRELGFEPLPREEIPYTMKYAWAHHFRRAADDVWVDVQWNVMQREWDAYGEGPARYDIAWMWERARPVTVAAARGDYELLVPSPEDMLFHLCMHLEGHGYSELVLFCDIVELLDRCGDRLDWDAFVALTRVCGAESSIFHVLLMVERLFGASMPTGVLPALEPFAFDAALDDAVFGGLTSLHLALDDIEHAAAPPPRVAARLETVARRQATEAMALSAEVRALSAAFREARGRVLVLGGTPASRAFPDPALPPFGELWGGMLADDLERMREALAERGFSAVPGAPDRLLKRVRLRTTDPALAGAPDSLTLAVELTGDEETLARPTAEGRSNRELALASLSSRLRRGAPRGDEATVATLTVVALEPEALLLWLLVRLGRREHEVVFGLCDVLTFLRQAPRAIDGRRLVELARDAGVTEPLARGLALTDQVASADPDCLAVRDALGRAGPEPRALAWARQGPGSLQRFGALRDAYLYALGLLVAGSVSERAGLVRRSLRRSDGEAATLVRLARGLTRHAPDLLRRRADPPPPMAYWIAPEPSAPPAPIDAATRGRAA